jgi:hypothetical protein
MSYLTCVDTTGSWTRARTAPQTSSGFLSQLDMTQSSIYVALEEDPIIRRLARRGFVTLLATDRNGAASSFAVVAGIGARRGGPN